MSVMVEKLENLERKVILALAWEDINVQVKERLKETQKRARVDGFRPGKAPLKMIDSMYGPGIRDEVLNEQAQKAFYDIVRSEKLKVAGLKSLEALEQAQQDDKVFKIAAIFEVYPEIKVGDLSEQEVNKVITEIGDAEIDKTIDILRKQRTRFNRVERAAQNDDRVIIDFTGKIDGQPFEGGSSENYPFLLGSGQMLPEFEAGVVGMKEGDVKDVSVTFPEDYQGTDIAGKTAIFTITLKNAAEPILPEINEDFAKSLGIEDGDLDKMRAEVKKNISREVNRRISEMTKDSVFDALLAVTPFDVPQALIEDEAKHLAERMKNNLVAQGMNEQDLKLPLDMFKESAKRRVAVSLIIAQLMEDEKLQATEQQIKDVVTDFADSYEDPQEVIDWYFNDKKNLQGPTSLAVEQNIVNYVLGKAKIIDKVLSFDEVMNQQAAQA